MERFAIILIFIIAGIAFLFKLLYDKNKNKEEDSNIPKEHSKPKKNIGLLVVIGLLILFASLVLFFIIKSPTCKHEWFFYKSTSTCQTNGVIIERCPHCEKTRENGIASIKEHDWRTQKDTSTCMTDGELVRKCNDCDKIETVPRKAGEGYNGGHDFDYNTAYASKGYTYENKQCKICEKWYKYKLTSSYDIQKYRMLDMKRLLEKDGFLCTTMFDKETYTFDKCSEAATKYLLQKYNETFFDSNAVVSTKNLTTYYISGFTSSGKAFDITIIHSAPDWIAIDGNVYE